jgi:hypothetical protein
LSFIALLALSITALARLLRAYQVDTLTVYI